MNQSHQCSTDNVAGNSTTGCSYTANQIEQLLQVDRKRLEAMITGEPINGPDEPLQPAEYFFAQISEMSGATISWPSRLKIGAKTKKDPYVKIYGTAYEVNIARQLINSKLEVKQDRVSLRVEIPHTEHSKIIGRKGRNTQEIMRDTSCHIHFPDCNKSSAVNNQVSISGPVNQVEIARQKLRDLSQLCVLFDLSGISSSKLQFIKMRMTSYDLFVSFNESGFNGISCMVKGIQKQEKDIIEAAKALADIHRAETGIEINLVCHTIIAANCSMMSDERRKYLQRLSVETVTQIFFSSSANNTVELLIAGHIMNILTARKLIIGSQPLSLHFDRISDSEFEPIDKTTIESAYNIKVTEGQRTNRKSGMISYVVLSGTEKILSQMYRVRMRILKIDEQSRKEIHNTHGNTKSNGLSHAIEAFRRNNETSHNSIKPLQIDSVSVSTMSGGKTNSEASNYKRICNGELQHSKKPIEDDFSISTHSNSTRDFFDCDESNRPKNLKIDDRILSITPDPNDSPIAHSLLEGVKKLNLSRNNRHAYETREQLLLKANRAVYDGSPVEQRQPTDHWAGYGFSSSLPAEILRTHFGVLDKVNGQHECYKIRSPESENAMQPMQPLSSLASVREEDEFADSHHRSPSSSSEVLATPSSSQNHNFFRSKSPLYFEPMRRDFSASTGFFEYSFRSETVWDIRVFVDPAMVLAQLGCSEYLARFREQEIDMEAFLLLDEQNLRDIGVSTMGARKKIFNAILKLRDSAGALGML